MTCTICTKYGKRGETGNLKKLALEVEHEIEREFNSKRVKGFDDGEVNKQSATKIESLFFRNRRHCL
jgi:hypothetical protein